MLISEIRPEQAPMDILLEADPDEEKVSDYLFESILYGVSENDHIIAVCTILSRNPLTCELMNIAVKKGFQQKGIGSQLLNHVISEMKAMGQKQLIVCTGTFGHQLTFYQRAGFRVKAIDHDYFLNNYPAPVFESGIQHKDRLRLELSL